MCDVPCANQAKSRALLASPFTTMEYKLFLQKGKVFLTFCPQSVEKYIINISGVLVCFMCFASILQLFWKAAKCLISNRVFTPCYRSTYTPQS